MVILNTCHIREKAAEKVYSELGRIAQMKRARAAAGGELVVAVAGCVAQAEGEEIVARQPAVDLVVGPQSYHRLPEMIARAARAGGHVLETDFPALEKFDALPAATTQSSVSAFLTVQEGCDKFCTFCVVPYTRGSEQSRAPEAVLAEARNLAEKGARARSCCWARTSMPITAPDGGSTGLEPGTADRCPRPNQIRGPHHAA